MKRGSRMEKYGVDELEDEDSKTATAKVVVCPSCGAKIRNYQITGVKICPQCGSEPFEG